MAMAITADDLSALERGSEPREVAPGEIDELTLQACREGDAAALRRFVVHYQRQVFAFLSRATGAGPHVDDLAQEVFLRAYRALPRFERRRDARVSTWLLTIAVRLVQDSRKRRKLALVELDEHRTPAGRSTPELEHRRREIARAFERAAARLSSEQRVTFVLAHFHGLSMDEIATLTEVSENTVKTRLFRARTKLRELLSAALELSPRGAKR